MDIEDAQHTRFYAAQFTSGSLVGQPPNLTESAPVSRAAGVYVVANNSNRRFVNVAHGTLSVVVVPAWFGGAQPPGTNRVVWWAPYDADNEFRLFWSNEDEYEFTGLIFRIKSGGVDYDTRIATEDTLDVNDVQPGLRIKLVSRWTGAQAELGVAYQSTLFLVGLDQDGGPAVVKSEPTTYVTPTEVSVCNVEIGSAEQSDHFGGWISRPLSRPDVLSDEECSRFP
jgi:hypothetical protein